MDEKEKRYIYRTGIMHSICIYISTCSSELFIKKKKKETKLNKKNGNFNRKTGTYFTLNTINLNKRKKEAIEINPN